MHEVSSITNISFDNEDDNYLISRPFFFRLLLIVACLMMVIWQET